MVKFLKVFFFCSLQATEANPIDFPENRPHPTSSSVQSNDSVFTYAEDGWEPMLIPRQVTKKNPPYQTSKNNEVGSPLKKSNIGKSDPAQQFVGFQIQSTQQSECRSQKDSGYSSRLGTDDLESSLRASKLLPRKPSSPITKNRIKSVKMKNQKKKNPGSPSLPILTLANSPVLVNRSYLQFYYTGDPLSSWATVKEAPFKRKLHIHQMLAGRSQKPARGKYPCRPLMPPVQIVDMKKSLVSLATHYSRTVSGSTSVEKLSLSSSLKNYANTLEENKRKVSEEQDKPEAPAEKRERLLSITRFQTSTTDLELPQSAELVKVIRLGSNRSSTDTSTAPTTAMLGTNLDSSSVNLLSNVASFKGEQNLEQKNLEKSLNRQQQGVISPKLQPSCASQNSMEVMLTAASQAKVRRKNVMKNRIEVKDISTSGIDSLVKIMMPISASTPKESAIDSSEYNKERKLAMSEGNGSDVTNKSGWLLANKKITFGSGSLIQQPLALNLSPYPYPSEVSKSSCQLSVIDPMQESKTKPAQSVTNLDYIQKDSLYCLRPAFSMDDLSQSLSSSVDCGLACTKKKLREGFLWRILGRASQKWPAYIQIVCIQNSQANMGGLGVRKGQQVRALYRVSGQVIVETETHHLASVPYECCRISRKYYGSASKLVQLSYFQLYCPALETSSYVLNQSPVQATPTYGPGQHMYAHYSIEMVAIQDYYECSSLDEIAVEAGDKLRVLYCDDRVVYVVKENREAGIIQRKYCRLTRKSQRMFQKWIDATCSPFQADFLARFNELPPSFLRLKTNATNESLLPNASSAVTFESVVLSSPKIKYNGTNNPTSTLTPAKTNPPTPLSAHIKPLFDHPASNISGVASNTLFSNSIQDSDLQNSVQMQSSVVTLPKRLEIASCLGKVMTVTHNYTPQRGNVNFTLRKGLQVRVLTFLDDGQTLCVMTKTGTQFNIPFTYLTLSRNSSDSSDFDGAANGADISFKDGRDTNQAMVLNLVSTSADDEMATSRTNSECGKIMTIIHNFTPVPENPAFTIRKGLRVKLLTNLGDSAKVVTKTGIVFTLPRKYLRLARKNSDIDAFSSNPRGAMSAESLVTLGDRSNIRHVASRRGSTNGSTVARETNRSPTSTHSDDQYTSSLRERRMERNSRASVISNSSDSRSNLRSRGNNTGSQVFQLC